MLSSKLPHSTSPLAPAAQSTTPAEFDFGFDAGAAPPRSAQKVAPSSGNPPDDDDDSFGLLGSSTSYPTHRTESFPPVQAAVDDFDLLGAFSQPAPPPRAASPPRRSPALQSSAPHTRSSSPPPHILGQMVEMGFSIPQARAALGATVKPSGEWDLEAAIDVLAEQVKVDEARLADQRRRDEEEWGAPRRKKTDYERDDDDRPPERPRQRPAEEEAPRPATGRRAREAAARQKQEEATAQRKVQDQANELLNQASRIGFSMFKSANAYWETSKATIQKALDEAALPEGGAGDKGKTRARATDGQVPGKPKWWREGMDLDEEDAAPPASAHPRPSGSKQPIEQPPPTLFQDSDHEDEAPIDDVLPQRPEARQRPAERQAPAPPPSAAANGAESYVSPWRRPKPAAAPVVAAPKRSPSPLAPTPNSQPRRTPSPQPPRPPRAAVPVSEAQLASATAHKNKGNELFKLGRFGDADAAYSLAIAALPTGTLVLVPLYNNRAAARLKNGDERSAAEDCTEAISIILGPTGKVDFGGLDRELLPSEAKDLNLRDQLSKALSKRAKAYEATEKWAKAAEDWATLLQGGEAVARSAGGSKLVSEGAVRCRKMVENGGHDPQTAASQRLAASGHVSAVSARRAPAAARPTTPKPKPAVVASGDAVRALKAAGAAAEAEDDLRLQLKDSVDARISTWKGGKETNLRALIASLDSVLWPELGWKTVGMHELISEGQLKVRYVRAIGKVHPDKVSPGRLASVQLMLTGGPYSSTSRIRQSNSA